MQSNKIPLKVVVPARFGSSRLPGKPLLDLGGEPMVSRVYSVVKTALPQADIVIAIDNVAVAVVLDEYGIPYVMTNSEHESGTDRVAEVARVLDWPDNSIIINVQGDEPLIPIALLQAFSDFCTNIVDFEMATICAPISSINELYSPSVVKLTLKSNDSAINFSRAAFPFNRDVKPEEWSVTNCLRHIGVYAYRKSVLEKITQTKPCQIELLEKLEQLRALWLGVSIKVMRWNESPPHGVDTPEDAIRVADIYKRGKS